MKLQKRLTIRNNRDYNEVLSLSGNLLLMYRIDHSERQTHMCIFNEKNKKIVKTFTIPFTFASIYTKKQSIFFTQSSSLYRIENINANPTVKQITSIPSSKQKIQQVDFPTKQTETKQKIDNTANPSQSENNTIRIQYKGQNINFSEMSEGFNIEQQSLNQNQLLVIQNKKYLIATFKGTNTLYLLNSKGELCKRLYLGSTTLIDHLLPLENESDKILLVTPNQFFVIYDIQNQTQTKKIKIPFKIVEGQSDSIKISHVQKNEYLINSFENLQVIDFNLRRIKKKVQIDQYQQQQYQKDNDFLDQKNKNLNCPSSPRMFVQNMIKINQSTFLGQYTLQYQGDCRLFFIDFDTQSLTTHYFDPNIKFIKLKRVKSSSCNSNNNNNNQNNLMMFNPSFQSNFIQLSFYSSV